ncbi:sterol-binding protein [Streptomyces tateyamensis]|uniref:Sterol-binding protein n=1 Tax=Streptomyces tateyamensis TaxID=565073 RepID=A0A2V4NVX9_9ACTN|nr:maleylpyruvate isomerase family mycothiol-dependent enzyme [Streptomyces tateyamensis]PYC88044.1 sterol-binding protein [Streptomyces tateyamensis]
MTAPVPSRPPAGGLSELAAANTATAEAIGRLLRDGADPARPIPGASWTIGEGAAHLALANLLMAELAAGAEHPVYGDGTPGGLAAANEETLAAYPERDPAVLAEVIEEQAHAFGRALAARPATDTVRTPMGPMDLAVLGSYLLTHQLGHGYDLARALGRPHMIDRQRVELCLPFLFLAMPRVLDPRTTAGLRAGFTVGLRGGSRFGVAIADRKVTVSQGPLAGADCTISCEPVTFLLLALGRRTPLQALARLQTLSWGRKPWLAPRFPSYFPAP